ncbi:hypothetical protein TNCT_192791 [Trichonephila clavata]|uniref:Uncharacterized protein n=1 Tax=Trichonephila clavata TaxID=2740835 RepID=A0A8X6G407_TRICU|nr:hypothetical protein TNCT_192791 [Trichonephila clavata]
MSKFWVFVYRNANDNPIIAATEEFSDESAPLRRLGSSFGTKAKELVESSPTKQSCFSTSNIGQGVPGTSGSGRPKSHIRYSFPVHRTLATRPGQFGNWPNFGFWP